jgi:ABC-2 type transport system ATP-binding protein
MNVASPSVNPNDRIVFENVSRFYGEVLGVNRVTMTLEPGITGLVGPNGSGKTTLMNLVTGLLRPTRGHLTILGLTPDQPEALFSQVGYCSQFDSFPKGMTGYQLVYSFLRVHGFAHAQAEAMTWRAIRRVNLEPAAHRKVAAYSKGMRQRIRLAQAISHEPRVMVLDEPLNGLDPMARAEVTELFKELRDEGRFVILSSHILHEVDVLSDQVVFLNSGYVVAEGEVSGVRSEIHAQPMKVLIRCQKPTALAARLFDEEQVVAAEVHKDGGGLLVSTRDADRFYLRLNEVVAEDGFALDTVMPADADVQAVYGYLIGQEGEAR